MIRRRILPGETAPGPGPANRLGGAAGALRVCCVANVSRRRVLRRVLSGVVLYLPGRPAHGDDVGGRGREDGQLGRAGDLAKE